MSILGGQCSTCCGKQSTCFDGVTPFSDWDGFTNATFLAGGISVGNSSQTLSSVTIYNDGATSPPVYCIVWPNDTTDTSLPYGPRPKARQNSPPYDFPSECVSLTPPSSFTGTSWTFTHSGLTLNANAIYWIVMAGQDIVSSSSGYGGWKYEDFTGYVDVTETCYTLSNASGNSGLTWAGNLPLNRYLFDWS